MELNKYYKQEKVNNVRETKRGLANIHNQLILEEEGKKQII